MSHGEALSQDLRVEEFRQINEYMRQSMDAMMSVTNMTVVGITTYLAAAVAFVFTLEITQPDKLHSMFAYLFLLPLPVLSFSLGTLAGHRDGLYRFQYYIITYFEGVDDGAGWGRRSMIFRQKYKGEAFDLVLFIYWALFVSCLSLFIFTLVWFSADIIYHLGWLLPVLILMISQSRRFTSDRSKMQKTWEDVKEEERGASCPLHSK